MIKNITFFFAGILLSGCLFFLSSINVKKPAELFFGEDFYHLSQEISDITTRYLPQRDIKTTQEALLQTFVASLGDPYTSYISKKEALTFQTMIQGDFEGIGAYIEDSPNGVYI